MQLSNDRSLILRVCGPNGESRGNFVWPLKVGAEVSAPDWKPIEECGNGLHGWLHGAGDHTCTDRWADQGARWIVASVETASIVMLGGKCKFPTCRIEFVGERQDAAAFIREHSEYARNAAVIGAVVAVGNDASVVVGALGTATAGDSGTATAGYSGTATAGYRGTATAGDSGTATAGYRGTATAGYRGTATAGYRGTATAGYSGTATAGDRGTATAGALGTATAGDRGTATAGALGTATAGYSGTATAGDSGTATAGDRGTATAGDSGTATAGDRGTATAGDSGTATAGDGGVISIGWYDHKANRYRRLIGYIGEDGLEPNVAYRCDDAGKFVRAEM